jgi:hypothetical protein
VPAGCGDRRAGCDDAGADLVAGEEPVAQGERQVVAVAEVSHGSDANGKRPPRGEPHAQQERAVIVSVQLGHGVGRRIEGQVLMDVDETWQQRRVAEVDDLGAQR